MKKISADSLITFTRQLAYLVKMRFPLDESLKRLGTDLADGDMRRIAGDMSAGASKGGSLSESLASFEREFPPLYRRMVEAGEKTDSLEGILDQLAEYLEFTRKSVKEIKAALMYPGVLFTFFAAELAVMMIAVNPSMCAIFEEFGVSSLPFSTKVLVALNKVLSGWTIGGVLLACVLFVNFWSAVPGILGDRLRLAMPILGDLFRKLSYAQFARAMALLLASGVPLVEAIENACRAVENLAARDHIMNLKRKVERGGTLSRALSEIPYFSSTFAWMVSCGEKREELPGMMMEIAEFYDREVKLSTSTGIRVIEPVGIIAVGLLFGLIVFAVFLPFYSLIGTMH